MVVWCPTLEERRTAPSLHCANPRAQALCDDSPELALEYLALLSLLVYSLSVWSRRRRADLTPFSPSPPTSRWTACRNCWARSSGCDRGVGAMERWRRRVMRTRCPSSLAGTVDQRTGMGAEERMPSSPPNRWRRGLEEGRACSFSPSCRPSSLQLRWPAPLSCTEPPRDVTVRAEGWRGERARRWSKPVRVRFPPRSSWTASRTRGRHRSGCGLAGIIG